MSAASNPITYPYEELNIDKAEIRAVEGMGLGLFATQDISAGELIFRDSPLLIMDDVRDINEFGDRYLSLPKNLVPYLDSGAISGERYERDVDAKTLQFHYWWTRKNEFAVDIDAQSDYWFPMIDKIVRGNLTPNPPIA